jgi:hypothetical protein
MNGTGWMTFALLTVAACSARQGAPAPAERPAQGASASSDGLAEGAAGSAIPESAYCVLGSAPRLAERDGVTYLSLDDVQYSTLPAPEYVGVPGTHDFPLDPVAVQGEVGDGEVLIVRDSARGWRVTTLDASYCYQPR